MTAFSAMVRTGFRQLLASRRVILMALIALLPAIVLLVLGRSASGAALFRDFHEGPIGILFLFVLPLTSLMMGSSALGDERRDGTLSFLVLRPRRREMIVSAKLLAAWSAAWLVIGGGGAVASVVLGLDGGGWSTLLPIVVATGISTLAYVAVFLLVGYLTRWAMLIGAGFLFFWEVGITSAADSLANVSLFRIGLTAYAAMVPESESLLREPLAALQPGTWGAIAKVVVIAGVMVVATAWLLRHRDIA